MWNLEEKQNTHHVEETGYNHTVKQVQFVVTLRTFLRFKVCNCSSEGRIDLFLQITMLKKRITIHRRFLLIQIHWNDRNRSFFPIFRTMSDFEVNSSVYIEYKNAYYSGIVRIVFAPHGLGHRGSV